MIALIPHPAGAAREPHAITTLPEVARRSQCSQPQDVQTGQPDGASGAGGRPPGAGPGRASTPDLRRIFAEDVGEAMSSTVGADHLYLPHIGKPTDLGDSRLGIASLFFREFDGEGDTLPHLFTHSLLQDVHEPQSAEHEERDGDTDEAQEARVA